MPEGGAQKTTSTDTGATGGGGDGGANTTANEDRTFSQAELNRIVKQEREKERSKFSDFDDLKAKASKLDELEAAKKTEIEKLAEELAKEKASGSTAALSSLRLEVALEKAPEGMAPSRVASLAKRLSGSTREELETDADALFKEFGGESTTTTTSTSTRPAEDLKKVRIGDDGKEQKTDMDDWMRSK